MKIFFILSAVAAVCYGSSLEILSAPSSVKFPDSASDLKTTQLSPINEYILGLSARSVDGFNVETDIFSRPRALALITVEGIDSLSNTGKTYPITANGIDSVGIEQDLALVFGPDRQSVQLTAGGITGSQLAFAAQQQTVDTSAIKTKLATLRKELEAIYQLASAIKASGAQLENTADVYRVTITGLSGQVDSDEKKIAIEDVQNAVNELNSALNTAYGNQVVVEVVAVFAFVQSSNASSEEIHHISKRDTPNKDKSPEQMMREKYQVTYAVSPDYPAIFAIFLGLVIILVVALIYIIVGMMSIDPGKDSIIYRMTTTRMKKD